MSQNLKLINKGDRCTPATYQFGRNERLNIHPNNYADLTDANTGACIRTFEWDFVRNMGYSPAKLLAGNEIDQFLDTPCTAALTATKSGLKHIAGGNAAAAESINFTARYVQTGDVVTPGRANGLATFALEYN